jgi:hypothetical protein
VADVLADAVADAVMTYPSFQHVDRQDELVAED